MKKLNLLKFGFLSLFCLLASMTWATTYECNFSGGAPSSTEIFQISGNYTLDSGHGTGTYNGTTYTDCLKIESSTKMSFTFTTTETMVLTLVFEDEQQSSTNDHCCINIDGALYTSDTNIITATLDAGNHELTRKESHYLFYVSLTSDDNDDSNSNSGNVEGDQNEDGNGSGDEQGEVGTGEDVVTCTFGAGSTATDTDHFTFDGSISAATDDDGNLKYGSVTIDGVEYDHYFKIDSQASATFTTKEDNTTLTLIVGPNDNLDGDKYIFINGEKVYVDSQVITYICETAGEYVITKGTAEYHIFYIGLDKEIAKVGESSGNDEDGNGSGDEQGEVGTGE
ncbi:MAG: hypothetical protein LUC88_06940, partial [Prevotella sp.]|nr:hypothetical protein [Prevotella sp.]